MKNMLSLRTVLSCIAIGLVAAGNASAKGPDFRLTDVGLGSLQACDDADAMRVRGKSSRSYSMGVASLSVLIYDPATGSQTNIDIAQFANSESSAMVSDPTSAAVEGVVGFTGLGIEIGGFRASLSQGALFFGGQSATQGAFSVNALNVPRFQ
ncbi:MAG TPA: hypothetical protein DDZ51_23050 [Planctomycetaceae bacterium]|nr:hypothetical protein [Planctomycetaceae bacterium]